MQYEIISSSRQRYWKWPAVANFVLGGAGAGIYVLNTLNLLFINDQHISISHGILNAIALLLICSGLSILPVEAGRPSRGMHILAHMKTSWISREIVFFIILFASVILLFYVRSFSLIALSILSSIGFMVSQAFIVFRSEAISVWKRPEIPFFFLSSGLASGWGILVIVNAFMNMQIDNFSLTSGIALISINGTIWIAFIILRRDPNTEPLMAILRKPLALLFSIGVGHVLPLFLLIEIDALWQERTGGIEIIAGTAVIAGIIIQKKSVIMSVGYLDNIVINISNGHGRSGIRS